MNGPTFAPPAPATAAKAAPPRPPATPKAAAKPDPDAGNGLRVLTYLGLHWLMIVFCGTLLGAAGAYAAWELLPSKYESTALIQVPSGQQSLASQGNQPTGKADFKTYVMTTLGLLKSEFVLNAALRDISDLPTIKGQKEPLKYLDEEVLVTWDGSELVKVMCKGHQPGDVKKIVDAVQKAFLKEVVEKEVADKKRAMAMFETYKQKFEEVLRARAAKKPGGLSAKGDGVIPANVPAVPGAVDPAAPVNPAAVGAAPPLSAKELEEVLGQLDPKIIVGKSDRLIELCKQYPIEIGLAETRMRELWGKIEALKTAPIDPLTLDAVDKMDEVHRQQFLVIQAKTRYETARGTGTDDAPRVANLKQIWEAQKASLQELRQEKAQKLEQARREVEMKKLAEAWEAEKRRVTQLKARLDQAREELQRTGRQLLAIPMPSERGPGLAGPLDKIIVDPSRTDTETLNSLYAQIGLRYELAKMDLDAPERVRLIQPASTPTQKDVKKQILGTVFAGLMGYVVLALGVIGFETVGRRVSSLGDLKAAGPAPVVGVIPCLPAEAMGRDPVKRAAANEALDKLRTYVAQTWLSRGATTVAVTSPLGDEGKAFAALGLASSLAQAGYKTLAVDFDLRDPALHTLAGVPNETGVCEVLRGEADARGAVVALPNGLDLLPAGKWSDEARRAAVGGRLEALLARLKEPYDCVVLHSHALLTAAESVEVARRCEVVLVCAQYRETKVPLLRKATDRVAAMEIPYSGVVYVGATAQESLC